MNSIVIEDSQQASPVHDRDPCSSTGILVGFQCCAFWGKPDLLSHDLADYESTNVGMFGEQVRAVLGFRAYTIEFVAFCP